MKRNLKLVVFLSFILPGCATYIDIPMEKVEYEGKYNKSESSVLVIVNETMTQYMYSTKAMTTHFQYPLKDVVPEMVAATLMELYKEVEIHRFDASNPNQIIDESSYSFIITPIIDSFNAKVPATVMSVTPTEIILSYGVKDTSNGINKRVRASCDNKVESERDKYYFETMNERVVASHFVTFLSLYEYMAARDAMVAISKCAYKLSSTFENQS